MTRRPLYRWKSFWFGVFVLGFLGWGWARSLDHNEFANLTVSQSKVWTVTSREGGVFYIHQTYRHTVTPSPRLECRSYTIGEVESPPRIMFSHREVIPGEWRMEIVIPYWLLTLLFLFPWSAFLAWRWRRLTRGRLNERASQIPSGE